LGYTQTEPTDIWVDNQAAIILSETYKLGAKVAHIVMRINYIHQEILAGNVRVKYIDTANQVADILTKALPVLPFLHLRSKLMHGFKGTPIGPPKVRILKKKSISSKLAKATVHSAKNNTKRQRKA
jgi:hypothetical protein